MKAIAGAGKCFNIELLMLSWPGAFLIGRKLIICFISLGFVKWILK